MILTKSQIEDQLNIEGYSIELPCTWDSYGQARVLVYVSNEIQYKRGDSSIDSKDLPMVTIEIGLGKERKTIVNLIVNGQEALQVVVTMFVKKIAGLAKYFIGKVSIVKIKI